MKRIREDHHHQNHSHRRSNDHDINRNADLLRLCLRNNEIIVFVHISTITVANPNPSALVADPETANNGQSPNNCTNPQVILPNTLA